MENCVYAGLSDCAVRRRNYFALLKVYFFHQRRNLYGNRSVLMTFRVIHFWVKKTCLDFFFFLVSVLMIFVVERKSSCHQLNMMGIFGFLCAKRLRRHSNFLYIVWGIERFPFMFFHFSQ